jgi:hypothetical protein
MSRRNAPKHSTLAIALSHAILADQIDYRMAQEANLGDEKTVEDCKARFDTGSYTGEPHNPPRPDGHKPYA